MQLIGQETCPLPEDPALAEVAVAMRDAGHWAEIVDDHWRLVYMTDDVRISQGDLLEPVAFALGGHYFGPEVVAARLGYRAESGIREMFTTIGGLALADTPGGRDGLRDQVHPELRDIVGELGLTIRRPPRLSGTACTAGCWSLPAPPPCVFTTPPDASPEPR